MADFWQWSTTGGTSTNIQGGVADWVSSPGITAGNGYYQPRSPTAPAPAIVLDANRTPSPQGSVHRASQTLDDLLYGNVIPISGGKRLIRGRPMWWTKPRTIVVPSLVSTTDGSPNAGQLISTGTAAGSTATVMDIAVSFGSPLAAAGRRDILQIKAGVGTASTIIYDMTVSPPVNAVGLNFTFYPGSETQLPDPTISADKGVGLTSAYRGQMYAVFKDFPIDLFLEGGNKEMPLFAALISDNTFGNVAVETFHITTGSSIGTNGTVDWTSAIAYWSGGFTSYRLVASELWGSHSELYDTPVVNLSTNFNQLGVQIAFIDGLNLLLTFASGSAIPPRFVLVHPQTGHIVCEANTSFNFPGDNPGNFTWSVDTTGASPIYVFASLDQGNGTLEVFRYDAGTNVISTLGTTGIYLNGAAPAVGFTVASIARGNISGGQAVFYVGSSAHVHKVVVNISSASYAITTFCNVEANLLHYLPQEDCLVVFQPLGVVTKYKCSDASTLWQVTLPFTLVKPWSGNLPEIFVTDGWRRTRGFFGYVTGTTFYLVDLTDGSVTSTAHVQSTYKLTFDSETKSYIMSGSGLDPNFYRISTSAGGSDYAFSDLALSLATLSGYADGDVTITGISDTFQGVILDTDVGYVDFLNANSELLNYEVVEDQTIRVFRIPDNPTINFTITPDMCMDTGKDGPFTLRQEQETSFASQLEIKYRDPALDYAMNSQIVKRPLSPVPTTVSLRTDTLQSDLIMTADQAVTLGTPVIYKRAAGGTKLTLVGLPILSTASPGDIVLASSGTNNYTAKIKQTRLSGSLSNQITAQVILTESAFSRSGSSGDTLPFTFSTPDPASIAVLLDGPLLQARDDLAGLGLSFRWIATSRGQDNWSGAQFFYSFDNVNYSVASGIALSTQTVHVGAVLGALAAPPAPFMTDYTNTIAVIPTAGDFGGFASVTYSDLMNGLTLAYVGAPGRWEVIGWQTVVANADGSYSFSGLLRGLYGTEVFSGSHASGDLFVPIPGNSILHGTFATSDLGDTLYYRGVGIGQSVLSALSQVATVSGNAEKPPAPVHLDAVVVGSDIALSCGRRSRYAAHATDWAVLESETADGWEFDILSGGVVVRTLASATPSATYLAANITTDFGSIPSSLTFRAYRIGHDGTFSIGRGFRTEVTARLS